ncbi:unnamed protein product [Camellia sinensis]
MGVASKAGCWAFKAITAGLGVATIYLAATFSVNVYRGLSCFRSLSALALKWRSLECFNLNYLTYYFFRFHCTCVTWTIIPWWTGKPIGLISLLDEDSNFPKATDLTFANKLKQHLSGNPCFKGERGGAFGICHYAGEVFGVFRKKGTKLYETSLKDEKPLDQWLHC